MNRWRGIINELTMKCGTVGKIDQALADRILSDLVGYSKRSSKKDIDIATLVDALTAYHQILREAEK